VGFVLTPELDIVGVDLDDVRDPKTGELSAQACAVVDDFDTYTEISPSGTGLRLFAFAPKGTLPQDGRKKGSFEIYESGRYLTLTGQRVPGTPDTINEGAEAVRAFHAQFIASAQPLAPSPLVVEGEPKTQSRSDAEVIATVKRNPKYAALWNGDASDHSAADLALCSYLVNVCNGDAAQVERLFRQSGLMRPKWDEKRGARTYGEGTIAKALSNRLSPNTQPRRERDASAPAIIPTPNRKTKAGDPLYEARQLVEIVRPGWSCVSLETHAANALRIEATMGDRLRFCGPLGWLHFDGCKWEVDDRNASRAIQEATLLAAEVRREAVTLANGATALLDQARSDDSKALSSAAYKLADHAAKVEALPFAKASLDVAAGRLALRLDVATFDQQPWLLGFENGVWDRGKWRAPLREDYLLYLCPLPYDPSADRSEWEAVLERMTGGDADFARTLQDVAGYVLSGASTLRSLPWLYGPKGTGKSTFAELLQTLLGEMAATVDPARLGTDANGKRGGLGAILWNHRLVVCSEAGNSRLDADLLKTLSGSDRLTVEFKYKEAFTALPRHVLMMVGNDAPRLDAYDDGLRDRVIALPFEHPLDHGKKGSALKFTGHDRIEAARKDPTSPLVHGFAAWALDGLGGVFQTQTIFRAPCIEAATAKFWADTDPLTGFWEDLDPTQMKRGILKTELRTKYETWCSEEGARPLSAQQFNRIVSLRGFEERKSNGKRFIQAKRN
jgi:putative DNA primase/helicase